MTRRRDPAVLALLWLIVTAYNYSKAYHIDDTAYLVIAKWIAGHPLHPMSGVLNWSGIDEPIYKTNQPHLFMYLMALWGAVFGFGEHAQHLLESVAAMICIAVFYRLACFFARETALWLTAMMILGPAFITGQNVMVDIPLLAAWMSFFYFLACEAESPKQTRRYAGAALACSAALLIKYSSLVLIPILCVSLLWEKRRRQYWTALLPVVTLGAWSCFNYLDYGGIHILTRPIPLVHKNLQPLRLLVAWILTVGGLTPIGLIRLVQSNSRLSRVRGPVYFTMLLGLTGLVAAVEGGWAPQGMVRPVLWVVFLVNGILNLVVIAPALRQFPGKDLPAMYLVLWVAGTSLFYVLFAPFIAARHVLLILPPLMFLALRGGTALTREAKIFGLAITVLISAGLCLSDWRFADFERTEAAELMKTLPKTGAVWADGHWGWQWYAEQAGMRQIDVERTLLRPGDQLAVAVLADHETLKLPAPMHLMRTDRQPTAFYDLFCMKPFYATPPSVGPWEPGQECGNEIDIFQVDGR